MCYDVLNSVRGKTGSTVGHAGDLAPKFGWGSTTHIIQLYLTPSSCHPLGLEDSQTRSTHSAPCDFLFKCAVYKYVYLLNIRKSWCTAVESGRVIKVFSADKYRRQKD